jgi:hypothetical protein
MAQVRAARSGVLTVNGVVVAVREGQAFDDRDDIVKEHSWMFELPIEEATSNPGQRRSVKR